MELLPKVFTDMEGEFIDYVDGDILIARFPSKERYMNPFGFMQGGIIVAAIDNTVASLSYLWLHLISAKKLALYSSGPLHGMTATLMSLHH